MNGNKQPGGRLGINKDDIMLSKLKIDFMQMNPASRFTNRRTNVNTGELYYELTGDMYALAFFAFYIDDEEREENQILELLLK